MAEVEFDYDGFMFRKRDIECEISGIHIQIEKLEIEKDKLLYELDYMHKSYESYIESIKPEDPIPTEEVKPKRLKKTSDKPSENHIEV